MDIQYTGEESLSKFKRVAEKLEGKCDKLLVTTLDDICWLLNCRGTDIDYNPVFFAYLLFDTRLRADLFVDPVKVEGIKDYLESINVTVYPYDEIDGALQFAEGDVRVGVTDECNGHLGELVAASAVELDENPIAHLKCQKNEVE